jgi:diguanylate cyclase (GGDEF)-like protein
MGAVLVAYLVSLLVRGRGNTSEAVDGWMVAIFEVTGAGLCLLGAIRAPGHRAIPLLFGLGVLSWAVGDVLLTVESAGGATAPVPSVADAFYLSFYPLVYAALILLVRRQSRDVTSATWLDGLVAGLGAAGVCAAFAFNTIVQTTGSNAAEVATNLVYPTGDLLLLALVVGVSTILPSRRGGQWILVAVACAMNAAGDTANLFAGFQPAAGIGSVFNGIAWPTAILLISISVWLPDRRRDPLVPRRPPGVLLPGLGATAGVAILLFGSLHHVSSVAITLAAATLAIVGIRLWLSVDHLRTLTHKRHRQAVTDDLTGLGNRRQLFYLLDDFFASDPTSPTDPRNLALLFVDLDHFKEINDSFGHSAGDELLRQLGPRLMATLRSTDVLVRVGGDELAVVVMDGDADYAAAVADRLVVTLEEPFVLGSVSARIGASIGIASAPADATSSAALLRCADLAMYRAKQRGSAYEVYRKDLDDDGNRLRMVEELRGAVAQDQLVLHYQSQIDLHTGQPVAVEALLRWRNPRLGMVPPLTFLPLAEEAGMMPSITAWVLDEALRQCAAWRGAGHDLVMSVNITVSNLLDASFTDTVGEALARHRLPASALTVEVTETTIIGDFDNCSKTINQLRGLGAEVSIDDFGAGFTSLAHLGNLAVSELKLDRTFTAGLAGINPICGQTLLGATVELGHALGLRVVAEGVEDAHTMAVLRALGCDLAQGFFIGRPVPAEDLVFARTIVSPSPLPLMEPAAS